MEELKTFITKGPHALTFEYQGLTDFLSEVLIFAYQQPQQRVSKKNPQWHRKAAF